MDLNGLGLLLDREVHVEGLAVVHAVGGVVVGGLVAEQEGLLDGGGDDGGGDGLGTVHTVIVDALLGNNLLGDSGLLVVVVLVVVAQRGHLLALELVVAQKLLLGGRLGEALAAVHPHPEGEGGHEGHAEEQAAEVVHVAVEGHLGDEAKVAGGGAASVAGVANHGADDAVEDGVDHVALVVLGHDVGQRVDGGVGLEGLLEVLGDGRRDSGAVEHRRQTGHVNNVRVLGHHVAVHRRGRGDGEHATELLGAEVGRVVAGGGDGAQAHVEAQVAAKGDLGLVAGLGDAAEVAELLVGHDALREGLDGDAVVAVHVHGGGDGRGDAGQDEDKDGEEAEDARGTADGPAADVAEGDQGDEDNQAQCGADDPASGGHATLTVSAVDLTLLDLGVHGLQTGHVGLDLVEDTKGGAVQPAGLAAGKLGEVGGLDLGNDVHNEAVNDGAGGLDVVVDLVVLDEAVDGEAH
eukprot:223182_1